MYYSQGTSFPAAKKHILCGDIYAFYSFGIYALKNTLLIFYVKYVVFGVADAFVYKEY